MMHRIHPTAVVDRKAELAEGVEVDAYCVIKGRVTIGAGTIVHAHSIVCGATQIGARCRIGPNAYVGTDPQHRGYAGGETHLSIGDDTIIREGASIHRSAQVGDGHATIVGSRCFLMAGAHVGHDCRLGDDITMANNVLLAGHVEVGDKVFLGGGCVVHQFCRIGRLAIVGGGEIVTKDVPPFAAVRWGGLKAYNAIGCRRAEMDRKSIFAIRAAFHKIHNRRSVQEAVGELLTTDQAPREVGELAAFVRTTRRGVLPSVRSMERSSNADEE